jgi:hypothetical protein
MKEKLLVCISALQATAAHWRAGKILSLQHFANNEAGLAAFREFLTPHTNVPVYVTVDAVEEDYRFEMLPHSFGTDRGQMVARKLRQHYRNTPYIGAWLQGRESDKRRDDRYLFSALTNPEIPAPWLRIVNAQELPLAAVCLLPMVSAGLVDKLQLKTPNLLIAAQHAGGLRLTFFRDRQFRLSRLTRGDASKSTDAIELFTGEISNTRLYLHALRTATLDEHLTILLLDRNDELEQVAQTIGRDNPGMECIRVGRAELASRLDMDAALLAGSSDALYLQLLGLQAPPWNIAPASVTLGYHRYRARRAIYASCVGVAALAICWSGSNGWLTYGVKSQSAEIVAQIAAQETLYQQVTRQFPPTPTNGENLKRAVEIAQALRENTRDPQSMMALVSGALGPSSNIVLREFGWRYGLSEMDKGSGSTSVVASSSQAAPGAPPPARRQSGYIAGEIRPFRGDYRAAIDAIEAFAGRLRSNPAVLDVKATKMPLNVSPTAPLTGNTLEGARGDAPSAEFELVIAFKPRI